MTKDEILQALRLTSMGRAGHPLQEELAECLAALFQAALGSPELNDDPQVIAQAEQRFAEKLAAMPPLPPKRGPGRPKKAD